jgi:hypothetical protein
MPPWVNCAGVFLQASFGVPLRGTVSLVQDARLCHEKVSGCHQSQCGRSGGTLTLRTFLHNLTYEQAALARITLV